jgi:heme/copper-type cytochrome/quinol oxidase subunit 3
MTETTTPPPGGTGGTGSAAEREAEEALFYHEADLNAAWTGARLAVGALSFLFGAFLFAYFYLRSLNSNHLWHPPGPRPHLWAGTLVVALIVISAAGQTAVLQWIKHGNKAPWQRGALAALILGVAAVGLQIWQLLNLNFWPGSSGFASVFTGFYPVYLVIVLAVMIWLEILLMRSRLIPAISFVEQPPTYAEAFTVQRFQAALSAFTVLWNYLAVVGLDYSDERVGLGGVARRADPEQEAGVPGLIHPTAAAGWSLSGSILTFAFPMALFIVVTTALYLLFTRPHQVPGHRELAFARPVPPDPDTAQAAAAAAEPPGPAEPGPAEPGPAGEPGPGHPEASA